MNSQLVHPIFNGGIAAIFTVDKLSLSSQEFLCKKSIPMAHLNSTGNSELVESKNLH